MVEGNKYSIIFYSILFNSSCHYEWTPGSRQSHPLHTRCNVLSGRGKAMTCSMNQVGWL